MGNLHIGCDQQKTRNPVELTFQTDFNGGRSRLFDRKMTRLASISPWDTLKVTLDTAVSWERQIGQFNVTCAPEAHWRRTKLLIDREFQSLSILMDHGQHKLTLGEISLAARSRNWRNVARDLCGKTTNLFHFLPFSQVLWINLCLEPGFFFLKFRNLDCLITISNQQKIRW